jgi:hypothetical protein
MSQEWRAVVWALALVALGVFVLGLAVGRATTFWWALTPPPRPTPPPRWSMSVTECAVDIAAVRAACIEDIHADRIRRTGNPKGECR